MRTAIALVILLMAAPVYGGDLLGDRLEIRPRYMDIDPKDGIFDAGSPANPYVIDSDGEQYEIRSRYIDIDPDDGIFDAGSSSNPWVIERR